MNKILALFTLATAIMVACDTQPTPIAPEIDIASDLPMLGPDQTSIVQAISAAVGQHSKIGGFQLKYLPFDDSLAGLPEPAMGVQNVKKMTLDNHILGLVGPYNSSVAFGEIPVASQADLAVISPTTTADCLTVKFGICQPPPRPGGVNNFFRTAARDLSQGGAMADFALDVLKVRKVAIVTDGFAYGGALADSFSKELLTRGGSLVLREQFLQSTNDFSDLLNRIALLHTEAIYLGGASVSGSCRIRAQMRGNLADIYFLGMDGIVDSDCIRDAGSGANVRIYATVAGYDPTVSLDPKVRADVAEFMKQHPKIQFGTYTLAAYDCALILIDAITRAVAQNGGRRPTRRQVLQAVAATSGLKALTGTWSFDANGDATSPGITFYRVEAGLWKPNASITVVQSSSA